MQAYHVTGGRAVFASGNPFDDVLMEGNRFIPGQCNNAYIFPGVGLGIVTSRSRLVPNETFLVAAQTLADQVSESDRAKAALSGPSVVKKIIVAIGLSPHSEATARYAAKWAELFAASINLVHVCLLVSVDGFGINQEVSTALGLQRESAQEALSLLAQRIRESCPDCQMTVLVGDPVEEVASLARSLNADLIVIGSRHQTGFLGRLFAPDQERKIIHRAPCPVLIYQEHPYKGEVAPAGDSWRKPLPAQEIYLPH